MPTDIVFPDNDEKEFIEIAEKLGYTRLIMVYPFRKIPKKLPESKTIRIDTAEIITAKELNKLHSRDHIAITRATGNDRAFFESKKIDIIYNLENLSNKDFIHHKASGMNHVMAKLAHENGISIAFSISEIIRAKRLKQTRLIARTIQNIRFCRKYGVDLIAVSLAANPMKMRSPKDIQHFMQSIGMESKAAQKSIEY